jgi:hypothetical protein
MDSDGDTFMGALDVVALPQGVEGAAEAKVVVARVRVPMNGGQVLLSVAHLRDRRPSGAAVTLSSTKADA